jgi:hypothetical protein
MGDYCILHAPGWEGIKADAFRLWSVYGYATAVYGVIDIALKVFGASAMTTIVIKGESRKISLSQMKDTVASSFGMLNLFATMEDPKDEVEHVASTLLQVHKNVQLLTEQLAHSPKSRSLAEQRNVES